MTQKEQIREHLKANGAITSQMAIRCYGITRLAAIIPKLEFDGMKIEHVQETNNGMNWARYKLVK